MRANNNVRPVDNWSWLEVVEQYGGRFVRLYCSSANPFAPGKMPCDTFAIGEKTSHKRRQLAKKAPEIACKNRCKKNRTGRPEHLCGSVKAATHCLQHRQFPRFRRFSLTSGPASIVTATVTLAELLRKVDERIPNGRSDAILASNKKNRPFFTSTFHCLFHFHFELFRPLLGIPLLLALYFASLAVSCPSLSSFVLLRPFLSSVPLFSLSLSSPLFLTEVTHTFSHCVCVRARFDMAFHLQFLFRVHFLISTQSASFLGG